MGDIVTRIGSCVLPVGPSDGEGGEHVRGHWEAATCADYERAMELHGGVDALSVWSSFTNMEDSNFGPAFIFTCWGEKGDGNPVAADGGHPDRRWKTGMQLCLLDHAVFVPTREEQERA